MTHTTTIALIAFLIAVVVVAAAFRFRARLDAPETPRIGRQLIGLSGYAGSGKDTAAEALLADGWKRVAVSDKIAELALFIDPPVRVRLALPAGPGLEPQERVLTVPLSSAVNNLGWTDAKKNDDVRKLLQALGNGCRQVFGDNAWVDATMSDLPDGDLVFTSVRFPQEANAIKALGGHIVRVERPGTGAVNADVTETALDGWDFDHRLVNNSDVSRLHLGMRAVVADLATR